MGKDFKSIKRNGKCMHVQKTDTQQTKGNLQSSLYTEVKIGFSKFSALRHRILA